MARLWGPEFDLKSMKISLFDLETLLAARSDLLAADDVHHIVEDAYQWVRTSQIPDSLPDWFQE